MRITHVEDYIHADNRTLTQRLLIQLPGWAPGFSKNFKGDYDMQPGFPTLDKDSVAKGLHLSKRPLDWSYFSTSLEEGVEGHAHS